MGFGFSSQNTLAEQLLTLATQSGAEAAEVFQASSLSRPIFFEANRLKQLEISQVEGTALRLWRDGRPGLAVAHGDVDPQTLVDKAIALSSLNDPEDINLPPGLRKAYPDLGHGVAVEQLVTWGYEIIEQIHSAYPDVICQAELECDIEMTRLINSAGLDYSYSDTTLSSYLSVDWIRGDDFLSVGDGQTSRDQLAHEILVHQILQRLGWAQRNVSMPQGRAPVLFTSKAADMLWATVHAALSGKRVLEKSSPWSDRIGDRVTDASITLSQAPDAGPFSCPFDDEGTATRPLVFIDHGTLRLFYTDLTIGKELGGGSTGNGFRPGLGSYPTPSLFNSVIQPGEKSLADLIASMENGLIVDQILGGGAGISGEFSINVDLGYRVRNGQILGRVKDTMVAGNVYTALNNIVALGSDADWNGSCYTPSVIVEGLSITSRQD